jgi:hypothetical protein
VLKPTKLPDRVTEALAPEDEELPEESELETVETE